MKKLFIFFDLFLLITLLSRPCAAQLDLILGITQSSITGGDSWKGQFGIQAGAAMPFLKISDPLSLRAEANLSMQGSKWVEETYDMEGHFNLLYLNFPVVVRYLHESGFFAEAGLQPGILLSAKDKYEDTTEDVKDYMKIFDLNIPIGIGYQINENIGVDSGLFPE